MQLRMTLLAVLLGVGVTACGGKAPESEATTPEAAAETAAAPECSTVQDARGRTVTFRPSVDAKQLAATGKTACDLAQDLVRRNDEQVKKILADICRPWDPESVARMRAILQKSTPQELEADAQMRRVANAMIMCTDKRDQTTLDMLFEPAIYSVGLLPARGEGCFAYLAEVHIEGRPGRGYSAQLLGSCAGQRLTSESETNLGVLGQALVTAGYTGALPATYETPKGETARFAPEPAAAAPAQAPSANSGGIPARFVGVYEQDPAACQQAEEASAPGDLGVIIRADAIESYELGCQLRTVSAASDEAFMGVFDCAVEGESEERTRSLRWSGEKLFIDGDATPYAKCNVAVPAPFEPQILESDTTPPPPAAAPAARSAPVAAPTPPSGDDAKVAAYARELSANWMSSGTCGQLKQMMLQFSQSSAPANVRVLQMEKMFDKAFDAGCIE